MPGGPASIRRAGTGRPQVACGAGSRRSRPAARQPSGCAWPPSTASSSRRASSRGSSADRFIRGPRRSRRSRWPTRSKPPAASRWRRSSGPRRTMATSPKRRRPGSRCPAGRSPSRLAARHPTAHRWRRRPWPTSRPALAALEAAAGSAAFAESLIAVQRGVRANGTEERRPLAGASSPCSGACSSPWGSRSSTRLTRAVRARAFPGVAPGARGSMQPSISPCALATPSSARPDMSRRSHSSPICHSSSGTPPGFARASRVATAHRWHRTQATAGELSWSVLLRPWWSTRSFPRSPTWPARASSAYFAQSTAGGHGPRPAAAARRSAVVRGGSSSRRSLTGSSRYGLTIDDFRDPHAVEAPVRLHRAYPPGDSRAALAAIGASVDAGFPSRSPRTDQARLAPPTVVESARQAIQHRLEQIVSSGAISPAFRRCASGHAC